MKKASLYIILGFLAASCGNTKQNEKTRGVVKTDSVKSGVKNSNNTIPSDTIYPQEQKIELDHVPASMSLPDRLRLLKTKYAVNYTEIHPEELKVEVLDRFVSEKKFRFHLKKKMPLQNVKDEKIFPVANIRAYVFKDSAQCANAVNNWYNCFGNDCNTVTPSVNSTVKTTPGFYIINRSSIICLDYSVEHAKNNWDSLINHIRNLFESDQSTVIRINSSGKLTWEKGKIH